MGYTGVRAKPRRKAKGRKTERFKIKAIRTLHDKTEIKQYIREEGGVFASIHINSDFFNVTSRSPYVRGNDFPYEGPHAILLVGYDDEQGIWIFQNSYGKSFGDNGFGTIHYRNILQYVAPIFVDEVIQPHYEDIVNYYDSPPLVQKLPPIGTLHRDILSHNYESVSEEKEENEEEENEEEEEEEDGSHNDRSDNSDHAENDDNEEEEEDDEEKEEEKDKDSGSSSSDGNNNHEGQEEEEDDKEDDQDYYNSGDNQGAEVEEEDEDKQDSDSSKDDDHDNDNEEDVHDDYYFFSLSNSMYNVRNYF
ncbi:hypothetical protein PIB30_043773 [Stylosanthes scabra]|uniref:Peptidase C1A papain C-terminal domain-containing protein n=1 Tax=Stylosanthes scabra TaxID=79078 RepID=A0ABU6QFT7_9FABA|nr:hypothetical protein [Stylosanthes scabra]